ncbi:hypothetical protein FHEFKHOI_01344 [Candidatus Methanoperedenaceae archaeon GB50]|nr:hypothetical protein FHEFKHOI_01344 [Candidatus Methanoperedenaceae archaeon GB50]CAD7781448.1 MAG: hypothetical protein KBONHNOK_01639 [Candidatus Methanoperedenaceae archaeon GB50]
MACAVRHKLLAMIGTPSTGGLALSELHFKRSYRSLHFTQDLNLARAQVDEKKNRTDTILKSVLIG